MSTGGLHLLGASGGLSNQVVSLRVKSIDSDRFREKLSGMSGSLALSLVNIAPEAMLDVALPFVKSEALGYGVDLETHVARASMPAKKDARPFSEFWPGLMIGTVFGVSVLGLFKLIGKVFGR